MQFATAAVHAGQHPDPETGAVIPPVYATSTFAQITPGQTRGYDYTRSGNPNFTRLEACLSTLENAQHACVFSSGVAAITAVVSTLKQGDKVIAEENIYGCTYRMFDKVFEKFGVEIQYVDFTAPGSLDLITPDFAMVWIESPTNPLLKVVDIQAVAERASAVGIPSVVDNTFASPYFQKPLDLGATLSLSSTTKYTNGHSDCLGGVVCTNDTEWQDKMIFAQKAIGLNPSPQDCWLIQRGIKTLPLRMKQHAANALEITEFLLQQDAVQTVHYPFHPSHPQYDLATKQMTGGSGIIVVNLNRALEETIQFVSGLQYFHLAESLGGVESLVCHPASMTHASIPKEQREKVGITDGTVRLSVGIEDAEDLIADLKAAL